MAVIFVHGVNTRQESSSYGAWKSTTKEFLTHYLSGVRVGNKRLPDNPRIEFPYWGDLGCTFAWNMACLPQDGMETLGGYVPAHLRPIIATVHDVVPGQLSPEPLTALARTSFPLAVDALCDMALHAAGDKSQIAQFIVRASAYANANEAPSWLAGVSSDAQLLARLQVEIAPSADREALGSFGDVFNAVSVAALQLKQAVSNVAGSALDRAGNFASTRILGWARQPLNANLTRFFGDVFIYLNSREERSNPGKIPLRIRSVIEEVLRNSQTDEPLIIIGHSLGGVITFDLLGHFCPEVQVDLFVSVESQVALFEEMKLYRESKQDVTGPHLAKKPANIQRWINIYDPVDILAYSAGRVFEDVDDFAYDSQTHTVKAHGACFQQARFYEKLRQRMGRL